MTRLESERLAYRIATALFLSEENPAMRGGALAVALLIADDIDRDGRITREAFLKRCGITSRSFRQVFSVDPALALEEWDQDREQERLNVGRMTAKQDAKVASAFLGL